MNKYLEKLAELREELRKPRKKREAPAPQRPDFALFAKLPKGMLHEAAGVNPNKKLPMARLKKLVKDHPDEMIKLKAKLVMDVNNWRKYQQSQNGVEKVAEEKGYTKPVIVGGAVGGALGAAPGLSTLAMLKGEKNITRRVLLKLIGGSSTIAGAAGGAAIGAGAGALVNKLRNSHEKSASNKYLEKIALAYNEEEGNKITAGGAAIVGGAVIGHNAYQGGHLTGRETMYHGTRPSRVKDILDKGIQASHANSHGGVTNLVESHNKSSIGGGTHVFLSRTKNLAHQYSFMGENLDNGNKDVVKNMTGINGAAKQRQTLGTYAADSFKRSIGLKKDSNTIKANVPTWKLNPVENPEVTHAKDTLQYHINPGFRDGINKLEKESVTFKDGLSPEFLTKSKHYKKNSIGEIGEYISKNKDRFMKKGLAPAAAGAALIGGGAYLAHSAIKDNKNRSQLLKEYLKD